MPRDSYSSLVTRPRYLDVQKSLIGVVPRRCVAEICTQVVLYYSVFKLEHLRTSRAIQFKRHRRRIDIYLRSDQLRTEREAESATHKPCAFDAA
jgi:hypothetical protein